eukprot:GHVS01080744.1.p1 GENE.GHVS01080744.1~~GHVS01080744.1.p1  ORF type:complete len:230 (+),score=64.69 GHVS01080744.1:582-1271(+)
MAVANANGSVCSSSSSVGGGGGGKNRRKRKCGGGGGGGCQGVAGGLVVCCGFIRQLVLSCRQRLRGYRVIVVTAEAPDKLVAFCVATADADCLVVNHKRRMAELVGRCIRVLQDRQKKLKSAATAVKPPTAALQKQTDKALLIKDMRPLVVSQLTQVPGVSEEIALAVVESFPTPDSLIRLTGLGSAKAEQTLSQLVISTRGCGKTRKLGKTIAKRLTLIYGPQKQDEQ